MNIKQLYVSCACSQSPNVLDWGENGLICFASSNSVVIFDPIPGCNGKVSNTLYAHNSKISSIRWITDRNKCAETCLICGTVDGSLIYWELVKDEYKSNVLKAHNGVLNLLDGKVLKNKTVVLLTGGSDSNIKIWKKIEEEISLSQTINLGYSLSISVCLSFLSINSESLIFATGLDNSAIDLYIENSTGTFDKHLRLKGHSDWVQGLDFTHDGSKLLLASSGQDNFVRIWNIIPASDVEIEEKIRVAGLNLEIDSIKYEVTVESVLCSHESWVYSVHWSSAGPTLLLLTASIDKTMIIWRQDSASGLWVDAVRVGEVGGNTLGFYGARFAPNANRFVGYSYQGSLHMWSRDPNTDTWRPEVVCGGHFREVTDLAWDPAGEYLLTVSADQTARLHAPWRRDSKESWHEIARPQVHGYDLGCVAVISRYCYASGAEEKVIRAFEAPANFVKNFRRLCQISSESEGDSILTGPKGATVPSLGLSNKAVFEKSENRPRNENQMYPEESYFTELELNEPPTEENLLQNTLWPEARKLYGHGYEVYSLAASPDGSLLASACKSTSLKHASIIIWCTKSWQILQTLESHTLTVTTISFSPNNNRLLTGSRDRRWSLFKREANGKEWCLIATTDKKTSRHSRLIWCCTWTHDSRYFMTGSRDGKVAVWHENQNGGNGDSCLGPVVPCEPLLDLHGESVTALACAHHLTADGCYVVAVGLESGKILLYKWNMQWELCRTLNHNEGHHLTVKRIQFRPQQEKFQFASCSSDCSVKIFEITL